jgi:hypothetical protein
MDPRDHLRTLSDGMACTVCDEPVPADRIRLLAHRDDVTFIQVACAACGSSTLGFIGRDADPTEHREPDPSVPLADPPLTAAEVLDMRRFLAGWNGDLASLLEPRPGNDRRDPSGGRPA